MQNESLQSRDLYVENPRRLWGLLIVFQFITFGMIIEAGGRGTFNIFGGSTDPPTILTYIGLILGIALMAYITWKLPEFFPSDYFQTPSWFKGALIGFLITSTGYRVGLAAFAESILLYGFVPSNFLYGLIFVVFVQQNSEQLNGSIKTPMRILGYYHLIGAVGVFVGFGILLLAFAAFVDIIIFIILLSKPIILPDQNQQSSISGNGQAEIDGKQFCPHCGNPTTNYGGFCGNCGKTLGENEAEGTEE